MATAKESLPSQHLVAAGTILLHVVHVVFDPLVLPPDTCEELTENAPRRAHHAHRGDQGIDTSSVGCEVRRLSRSRLVSKEGL